MREISRTLALVQLLHYHPTMPTLVRLAICKIVMYAADHLPPHFHIIANDGREALVEIATLSVLAGNVGRRAQVEALTWAAGHALELQSMWNLLNPLTPSTS